jgi:hypothetical protein
MYLRLETINWACVVKDAMVNVDVVLDLDGLPAECVQDCCELPIPKPPRLTGSKTDRAEHMYIYYRTCCEYNKEVISCVEYSKQMLEFRCWKKKEQPPNVRVHDMISTKCKQVNGVLLHKMMALGRTSEPMVGERVLFLYNSEWSSRVYARWGTVLDVHRAMYVFKNFGRDDVIIVEPDDPNRKLVTIPVRRRFSYMLKKDMVPTQGGSSALRRVMRYMETVVIPRVPEEVRKYQQQCNAIVPAFWREVKRLQVERGQRYKRIASLRKWRPPPKTSALLDVADRRNLVLKINAFLGPDL